MTVRLSLSQARRIALNAQGLARVRPEGPASPAAVSRIVRRLQLLQIDSVNVLSRSHYLPVLSRVGSYDPAVLDRLSTRHPRRLVEYWAHEASFIDPELFPYLRPWQRRTWMGASRMDQELRNHLEPRVLELLDSGPALTATQIQRELGHEEIRSTDGWGWNWSAVKRVLEDLFGRGEIGAAGRSPQFERLYGPVRSVLPRPALADTCVPAQDALHVLAERASGALGIGSARCIADYFRTPVRETTEAIRSLEARGIVRAVEVDGWNKPLFVSSSAVLPRRAEGRALLSPFDSMVFERGRLQSLFGFHYRIEIYTPAPKRRYGYYVLPFLLRETMAARVDLKADRSSGRLLVRASHAEPEAPADTAAELAGELLLMAVWLGLGDVVVGESGNLAAALRAAVDTAQATAGN
ncbi:winged helix-turn-helix domain-containing protein [Arthrobacter sp. H41]|uniref:winged helix-turn-helix domain-containing protein n=1 Tax=Arthrobacter sp. H41 TaxID=1312978 RepID=UPI0004B5FC0C|nr:crosslink repair DNA glycosylase YcaQ family protein [Arthrobacter sp. H41]